MSQLFHVPGAVKRDAEIEAWMHDHADELGEIAQHWYEVMRNEPGGIPMLMVLLGTGWYVITQSRNR